MRVWRLTAVLLTTMLSVTALAQRFNWQSVKPRVSTQADAIHLFGTPDLVQVEFDWKQFLEFQSRPSTASTYSLKYWASPSRPDVALLNGPLGRASSGLIYIHNGKIEYVEWDYCCIYREPARQLWLSDPAFDTRRNGKILIGTKQGSNAQLVVSCSSDSGKECVGDVSVMLMQAQ